MRKSEREHNVLWKKSRYSKNGLYTVSDRSQFLRVVDLTYLWSLFCPCLRKAIISAKKDSFETLSLSTKLAMNFTINSSVYPDFAANGITGATVAGIVGLLPFMWRMFIKCQKLIQNYKVYYKLANENHGQSESLQSRKARKQATILLSNRRKPVSTLTSRENNASLRPQVSLQPFVELEQQGRAVWS